MKPNKKCSLIEQKDAKALFSKIVLLKEISSGVEFKARVVDYCFEDQKGIIVSFDKKVMKQLHSKKNCDLKDPFAPGQASMDLRDIFDGDLFEYLGEAS